MGGWESLGDAHVRVPHVRTYSTKALTHIRTYLRTYLCGCLFCMCLLRGGRISQKPKQAAAIQDDRRTGGKGGGKGRGREGSFTIMGMGEDSGSGGREKERERERMKNKDIVTGGVGRRGLGWLTALAQ